MMIHGTGDPASSIASKLLADMAQHHKLFLSKLNNYSDFIKDPKKIPTPQTMRISLENNAQIPKRCIMQDWLQTVIGKVRKKAKHRTVDL